MTKAQNDASAMITEIKVQLTKAVNIIRFLGGRIYCRLWLNVSYKREKHVITSHINKYIIIFIFR